MNSPILHQDPQVLAIVHVRTAGFGMLGTYLDIPPGRIHAEQPGVLFQVPQPRTSLLGKPWPQPMRCGTVGKGTNTPLAVLTLRVGRLFIGAAFNPLDPATRAAMLRAQSAGELPVAVEFDVHDSDPICERMDYGLLSIPDDVFGQALRLTEGRAAVTEEEWLPGAGERLLRALPSLGLTREMLGVVDLSCFLVLPVGQL